MDGEYRVGMNVLRGSGGCTAVIIGAPLVSAAAITRPPQKAQAPLT